jgi:hypothetical protein
MPLSKDRATPRRVNVDNYDPIAAGAVIFAGAILMLNTAGDAVAGSTSTNLKPRGVAQAHVDNASGGAGAQSVSSMKGSFRFKNDGSVTRADIGATSYVVDDETVAKTDGTSTRSALGNIIDVDASGVWVDIA